MYNNNVDQGRTNYYNFQYHFNSIILLKILLQTHNTGRDNNDNNAVIPTAQTNKGIRSALMLICFILIIMEIKFTAPRIDVIISQKMGRMYNLSTL